MKMLILLLLSSLPAWAGPDFSDRLQLEKVYGPKAVKVVRAVGNKETSLYQGDAVFVGDEIHTAAGQIVELSAWDKSAWKVAPNSRLKLESRKPDKKTLFYWTMNLVKGGMWGKVEKEAADKNGFRLKVKTKYASMGIRGTEYLLSGDDKLSSLDVLEGVVWWGGSAEFEPGSYKEVKAGQHAEMGPDGKVNIHSSQGDVPTLAKRYGVVPADAQESAGGLHSIDSCKAQGKGWKAVSGSSSLGECTNEGDNE
jgi:hypothetical protein